MKEFKNYKEYYINNQTWDRQNKIDNIKELLRMTVEELSSKKDWEINRFSN